MSNRTRLTAKEREIRCQASEMLAAGTDAVSFSARFFGPDGELTSLARDRESRRRLLDTELYRWLKAEYSSLRLRESLRLEAETGGPSGV